MYIKDLMKDILNEKLFEFVEVDFEVPDELYDNVSEMSQSLKILLLIVVKRCYW
jgi:hypothetical protein